MDEFVDVWLHGMVVAGSIVNMTHVAGQNGHRTLRVMA